ncbi:hypothetical protein [uncultured Mobiluncus sp.]|uniref:hypothetical protein n=1 Tax=uncultured Mobiluncus sp. TaxID=293425 RepID=UPI0028037509|nr:hypothetical protein [uncultured Mobiluncus sp.]
MTGVNVPGSGQGGRPAPKPANANPNLVSLGGTPSGAVPLDSVAVPPQSYGGAASSDNMVSLNVPMGGAVPLNDPAAPYDGGAVPLSGEPDGMNDVMGMPPAAPMGMPAYDPNSQPLNPSAYAGYGYGNSHMAQPPFSGGSRPAPSGSEYPGYPGYPAQNQPGDFSQAGTVPPPVGYPPMGAPDPRYAPQPMDPRLVVQRTEEQYPDLQDIRARVPFNMPTLGSDQPAVVGRASRRKKRDVSQRENRSEGKSGSFTLPGDPNAGPSLKELLGQPVSNMAAATILSPKEIEDSDGLQMRAVGLAVGEVPEVDARYEIPYIAREHPSYYTGYEISLIMESIRDPEHARQVLARIVAIPRWIRWVISLFGGVCGAAVSALNAFLSLIAFTVLMSIVLLFTYSFASRIGSGRFYDPTGYKVIWLGSFMPIGLLSAIIVARALVGQPWLAVIAFVVTTLCGILWTTWIQKFQIRRLLSSEIPDEPADE